MLFLIILNYKIAFLLNVLLIMKKNLFGNYLKNMKTVALQDLLNNNVSYCFICAMPIKDSYDMKISFIMLNE